MGIWQNSNDDLSALISSASGVTVTSSQYTILSMKPTTSADLPASGGKNTKVRISMNSGAPLRGQMTLYYDRLDLGALANFQPYLLAANPNGMDVSTVLQTFFNQYGFLLTMNDIADAVTSNDANGNPQVTLTALPTSLGYTGTFVCKFAPLPNISNAFFSNVLGGF